MMRTKMIVKVDKRGKVCRDRNREVWERVWYENMYLKIWKINETWYDNSMFVVLNFSKFFIFFELLKW
jgi:hypothetical protein